MPHLFMKVGSKLENIQNVYLFNNNFLVAWHNEPTLRPTMHKIVVVLTQLQEKEENYQTLSDVYTANLENDFVSFQAMTIASLPTLSDGVTAYKEGKIQ